MWDKVKIYREVLPNGVTLVVETLPHLYSATAGVWVKGGSRTEKPSMNGTSHFIEHLLFKGTPSRTYSDIYRCFDRMGGVLDAFTSREIMGFYFRVQQGHFEEAFEVLSDMVANPSFPPEEVERERGVILEEIKMVNDSPGDLAGDLFLARAYPGHPMGRPVQGTRESISSIQRSSLLKRYQEMVRPQNLVVTVTGNVSPRSVRRQVAQGLGRLETGESPSPKPPKLSPGTAVFERNHLEQAQLIMAFGSEPASSPEAYKLMLLANLLGGTMSSRLFTEIREKLGLVYSISAEHTGFLDAGLFIIQAAAGHDQANRTVQEILNVLLDVLGKGITEDELDIARDNLLGGFLLSMESPSSRMGRMARNELYYRRQRSVEEVVDAIKGVSVRDLVDTARSVFHSDRLLVGVMGYDSALKGLEFSVLEKAT